MADAERASRTTSEVLAALLQQGGKILVVGGSALAELPDRFLQYPRLLFWNDDKQGIEQKEVPQNTRAILVHRWMSHTVVWRMRNAAKQLHIPVLPNLRTREIKELLSGVMSDVPREAAAAHINDVVVDRLVAAELVTGLTATFEREFPGRLTEDQTQPAARVDTPQQGAGVMANAAKGTLKAFIAKNCKVDNDYTELGSLKREGVRLLDVARREGFSTTEGSILQGVRMFLREYGRPTAGQQRRRAVRPRVAPAVTDRITEGLSIRGVGRREPDREGGDFTDFERLVDEAITALKLIKETLPQIKREVSDFRKQRAKLRELLA